MSDDETARGWKPGPARPAAEADVVHVWRLSLDPPAQELADLSALCDADEQARAARFVFEYLGRRFLAGRGALRALLGAYVGASPAALRFYAGPHGKLYLSDALEASPLQFNVSNSGDLALVAIVPGRQVGVDLELHRELTYGDEIARRHFAPRELARLPRAGTPGFLQAFYNTWTRKEAFIKLTGEGLHRALDSFEVSVLPGEVVRLERVDDDHAPHQRFTLAALEIDPGYTAALAVEGPVRGVRCFGWPPLT